MDGVFFTVRTAEEQVLVAKREDNKVKRDDRAAHDWYRFVLAFPPHLVRQYLSRLGVNREMRVLDPFCGTGTTLVECKKHGIPSFGVEVNPMAGFATKVKVNWDIDPAGLLHHAKKVSRIASKKLKDAGIHEGGDLPLFSGREETVSESSLRRLPEETSKLLLKNSISPLPLHKSLVLLETLEENKDHRFHDHERLALARALVSGIGNLRFGPEVGVGPPKTDAPVLSSWLHGVESMAKDLKELSCRNRTEAAVHQGDARTLGEILPPHSVDAVITSPPYPNEKDYTRTTRLESILLGFIRNRQELRELKQHLVRSNTRNVYKDDTDDLIVADHKEIQQLAETIEDRRAELKKTSGFERLYGRVARLYFGGMMRHLSDLRSILRPGAQLAYIAGDQASYFRVMIRTGRLLADIAESLGYDVTGIDLFRTRRATATRSELREEVVLLHWSGE